MKVYIQNAHSLGRMIRDTRIKKGWTQADLGRQVHMLQKDISLLEHDPGSAKLSRLLAVCAALELKLMAEESIASKTSEDMW